MINLGLAYRRQEKYDEAITYYQRALEANPNEVPVYAELGTIYMTTQQLDKAVEIVEQGLRHRPNSAHLHALLAAIYSEKGNRRLARSNQALVHDVQHFQERHVGADALRVVGDEASLVVARLLPPDLERQVHHAGTHL